jgi:hypothetical protein
MFNPGPKYSVLNRMLATVFFLFVACAWKGCVLTPALLDQANPNKQELVPDYGDTEAKLQRKQIPYTKHDGYFIVEKKAWRKTGDYALLCVGLPFTIIGDCMGWFGMCCLTGWLDDDLPSYTFGSHERNTEKEKEKTNKRPPTNSEAKWYTEKVKGMSRNSKR